MIWANFIHIYQPPTQKEVWIRRVAEECYRKIFKGLLNIPGARITVNINGVLCELLEKYGGQDILDDIRELLKRDRIELTGSAKYHAFLPLLPENEIERQILLNEESLNKYFGFGWKKGGFFSPEMAYSKKVAKSAKKLGYNWMIVDELAFPSQGGPSDQALYQIEGMQDFYVFFRDRKLSFTILSSQVGAGVLPTILRYLGPERLRGRNYSVTAMDGETFGHHRPGLESLLFEILSSKEVALAAISDLINKFSNKVIVDPRESSWATTKRNLKENNPFARWNSKDNIIQQKQWELTNLAIRLIADHPEDSGGRAGLDMALHSDQYWWSSAQPWWSLEMIERGAYEFKKIILNSPFASRESKQRAEELYREIVLTGFEWQRTGLVDEISRHENEEIQEMMEVRERLYITKEEYKDMIANLKNQISIALKGEDYHRAAMIKDRIRELTEEMEKS
ncbi:MAG: hypothetical protein A3B99_01000 [Candidatus Yanofskybacteria bacterium RIFCSPHIGHO2_02_FULL_44_12b]|uniref:UVR domain-containing protein n=2 Tax=Candidatus Yanofskyibacteriota TaxID=1752733 RepID=A0A1F8GLC4_9BACT|nr:MAG: hypothetical protein UW79_C0015G0002 [Candidatus Yanofskybacteria bacterium GW2011_GWA2_44_9]OGN04513.1 MAG: hypothetical protein A2659_02105 [Candidatus Yanofskybacteria bacterium RIFCSPHIGHO2_01_FULL_44_24]OGN15807.1 MAG: hypothetical protein A3B99_01000 [Candidatus Yanofskybacteria bacterium RIFCSPHIGHO2_02_FULL_44_12b]OGN26133.1 MAG: hypothetical protein A2925_05020 [Candidatus Yanofskybacteria bacterium RIFCSPLOWO2_01_FULL_44_22]